MLAKSEITLLTVTVLGTLAAWLAVQPPSFVSPIHGEPSLACGVPASALRDIGPSSGEAKASFSQASRIFHTFQQREAVHAGSAYPVFVRTQDATGGKG